MTEASTIQKIRQYTLSVFLREHLAKIISATFHPLILPAIAFTVLIAADSTNDLSRKLITSLIALTFSTILVFGYIFWLKRKGFIDSTDIIIREQRINPLAIAVISYFIGFLSLKLIQAPDLIQGLMFCYATNTLLVLLITNWWKVSIHTTAISGPLIVFLYQFGSLIFPWLILIPLVGASRLVLKRHTLAQVIAGAAIGIFSTALQVQTLFA